MIEAQEQLKSFMVADWPNLKKSKRAEIHRDLFKKAYPESFRAKNYITIEDLGKVLGR